MFPEWERLTQQSLNCKPPPRFKSRVLFFISAGRNEANDMQVPTGGPADHTWEAGSWRRVAEALGSRDILRMSEENPGKA